jgi:hypothetical protein
VRKGGLEPPRLAAPDPKSGASANSATFARVEPTTSWTEISAASIVAETLVGNVLSRLFPELIYHTRIAYHAVSPPYSGMNQLSG